MIGMNARFYWLWALLFAVGGLSAQAQTPSTSPRVVVVLAGGGAKGFAHLAVLRRLEKDGVRI